MALKFLIALNNSYIIHDKILKEKIMSLSRSTFLVMIISTALTLLVLGSYEIYEIYNEFKIDGQQIRNEYMQTQKDILKNDVEKIVFYARNMQDKIIRYGAFRDKERIQKDVILDIFSQKFSGGGYFFGRTFTGDPLFSKGKITKDSNNLWNLTDPKGNKFVQAQKEVVQNSDGGFIEYYETKPNDGKLCPKLSFVMSVPDWDWMIGAELFIDDIEKTILEQKKALKKAVLQEMIILTIIGAVLFFLLLIIALKFSANLKNNFRMFEVFFNRTVSESTSIDLGSITFPEFKLMAFSANRMIELLKISNKKHTIMENKYLELKKEISKKD